VSSALLSLSYSQLLSLADALDAGRIGPPFGAISVGKALTDRTNETVGEELRTMASEGATPTLIARFVRTLAAERLSSERVADRVELVWTGPEAPGSRSRDTLVVMRELFTRARTSVLVAGFALYQGRSILSALAERMDASTELVVRLFLNIARRPGDNDRADHVVREFAKRFVSDHWPGRRLPALYYDPRALDVDPGRRASLHAKCVIVDERFSLVTSANLTEAAQQRNIEAGLLVDDPVLARSLSSQFETLVDRHLLRPVPLTRKGGAGG
jgi:phosphatidylserine/phosphatidylglycerophosphate/cardiolipin synthase-like enzyme